MDNNTLSPKKVDGAIVNKFSLKNEKNGGLKFSAKKWLTISLIVLLIISAISGGVYYFAFYNKKDTSKDSNPISQIIDTVTNPTPTPTPEPVFIPNPITGELMTEAEYNAIKNRPFMAVMIQNNTSSRPEYGLNEADIVYEALVESRITRFMGVFWSKEAARVQSLRSARKYYIDLLGDYSAPVYMHIGYSSGDKKIDSLTAMNSYGIRRIGDLRNTQTNELAYSRDAECEKIKAREHCAYTSTSRLWEIALQKGWTNDLDKFTSWKFDNLDESKLSSGQNLTDFTVHFRQVGTVSNSYDSAYSVTWKYDPTTKAYLRFNLNGTPYLDGNGKQISTSTIIYQKVTSNPMGDVKGHQYIESIGSGDAFVMMQGKVFSVKWKKLNYDTKTKFTNATTGDEFVFQRGRIWVSLVTKGFDYTDNTPKTNQ